MLHDGELGIHPPGALGVGFYVHAQAECFVGRTDDGITDLLKKAGLIHLTDGGQARTIALRGRIFSNLLEADALEHMPELLFVCCNPDQLGALTLEVTRFIENLAERGRLKSVDDIRRAVPILLILPNGILSEQTFNTYEEQLHESLLMGRLPDLTETMIAALLDRMVRGVSLQAGGRRGSGTDTVYVLEKKGTLVFAGGGEIERRRIEAILSAHGYPFKHAQGVPGTRIEFDKAMISIVLNVGGLIHMVKDDGSVLDLRMGDLCKDPSKAGFVAQITRAVFDVGIAAGAYPEASVYDDIWAKHRATILSFAGHVTSSVKQFRDALDRGLNSVKLFSNEEWILTPLGRYAGNAGLKNEEKLFKTLARQVQASLAKAIRFREGGTDGRPSGARQMRLTAQRSIGVELYEAGPDDMVLVGTMLDDEHLIKLEMNVYLPDEQITRSRLDMIRVPFPVCREVESVAESLVGLRIERGVLNEISNRIGGRVGCSHIKELATNIVYFAASNLVRRRAGVDPMSTDYVQKSPDERFALTKDLLRDSCLAYCQTTAQGLDERIGIKRVGEQHTHPQPLGDCEPSLGFILKDRTERFGGKTYLRYRAGDQVRSMTFAEFSQTTQQIARHLIEQNVRPGDRIAMLSENRPEMFMFELAAMSIGAVTVPIFAGYPPAQVAYVLGHAQPGCAVVSGKHQLDKIERKRHPFIKTYYCMDFDKECRKWGAQEFASLTTDGGALPEQLDERIDAVRPDDLCMVMYTSGTTGPPKGVRLSHANLISQQKAITIIWDVNPQDVLLSYLPWHHSFGGLIERFLTLYHGTEFCLDDSRGRDLDRLIDNWKRFDPSIFLSVPRVHDQLLARCREDEKVSKWVFDGRLRWVFTAGAPLPEQVGTAYKEHGIPVLEGWGLTETAPACTLSTMERAWQSGCVGFPIPGVTIRMDSDQEILVKGPNVMSGYLDDEEATSRVIDENGWFHTGDLGEFTSEGLRLLGRKDGAFKLTTGEKVHPQRVENCLVNESPYVSMALAIGSGKDFVVALIFPDFSRLQEWAARQNVTADNLLDHPAVKELFTAELERVNPLIEVKFQRVRRAVLINSQPTLADGELTPSGKIVRRTVLNRYNRCVSDLYADQPPGSVIQVEQRELQRTQAS